MREQGRLVSLTLGLDSYKENNSTKMLAGPQIIGKG